MRSRSQTCNSSSVASDIPEGSSDPLPRPSRMGVFLEHDRCPERHLLAAESGHECGRQKQLQPRHHHQSRKLAPKRIHTSREKDPQSNRLRQATGSPSCDARPRAAELGLYEPRRCQKQPNPRLGRENRLALETFGSKAKKEDRARSPVGRVAPKDRLETLLVTPGNDASAFNANR